MSGGVDSTIAVHLLKAEGCEVMGVHLIFGQVGDGAEGERSASASGAREAEQAAAAAGVDCRVIDCRREFQQIVSYFCESYNRGVTPNPCVRCNPEMKFRKLCDFADEVGADSVATGHYARVVRGRGRFAIQRGLDSASDQSYVLQRLSQAQLARVVFPLGTRRKAEVRTLAARLALPAAQRPGSQEVCFAPGRDHTAVLRALCPDAIKPGPIRDTKGRTLGRHPGIQFFTVGQRRGLGIALGAPRYVVALDPSDNTVVIGTAEETQRKQASVSGVSWMAVAGLDAPRRASVQIRYNHQAAPATLVPQDHGRVVVVFDEPQSAITPGQAAAFYEDETVLGGGWIDPYPSLC